MKQLTLTLALWLGLATTLAHADAPVPSDNRTSVEMTFDRYKGKFYALYGRALRDNPTLKGKVTLRFTVSPQGVFSSCRVIFSELNLPELERRFCEVVESMHMNPIGGQPQVIDKTLEFFPAG